MVRRSVLFEVRTEVIYYLDELRLQRASTTHHPNVFTPILSLSEGRAGIAWVPSNKTLFPPPPRHKAPLAFPQMFSLYFYSYTILTDSLSRLQRVK
jgi:hypothetical protein